MIPRIVHYCWFGEKPFTSTVKNCIKSWKKHLPEYQFILWNEENSPMEHSFVDISYRKKKYAFASDYVRLFALKYQGGIYLDTDMLLLKPLDDFIDLSCFIGKQDEKTIAAGAIGASKNHPYINACVACYDQLKFDLDKMNDITIPNIMTNVYNTLKDKHSVKVRPPSHFYPYPFEARTSGDYNFWKYVQPETYAVHLWDASWIPDFQENLGEVPATRASFYYKILKGKIRQLFNG